MRLGPHNGKKEGILPIREQAHFQVYQKKALSLAVGDQVRVTENSFSMEKKRLHNGDLRRVSAIKNSGEIVLDGKYTLSAETGNLAHGYCITSHSSQGKTVDCVIIAESEESLSAASLEQFYVSLSRGRHSAVVFTHDKEELIHAVKRLDQRPSAHDLQATKGMSDQLKDRAKTTKKHKNSIPLRTRRAPDRTPKNKGMELEL